MTDDQQFSNRRLLFFIGNLSIFMIGLGFAIRTKIAPELQTHIYDKLDLAHSATLVGDALAWTFLGFAFTLLFGSALLDWLGMKVMLLFSSISYIVGSLAIGCAGVLPVGPWLSYLVIFGLLLTGLGWGAVEAASNPMIAALYPEDKTHRLNILHAWWPAGIVAGGLLGLVFSQLNIPWYWNLAILGMPGVLMFFLVLRTRFPVTERVANNVTYRGMVTEIVRKPLFIVFFFCMMFTAAAELAPGTWVSLTLSNTLGMDGILVLIYVSLLMFIMRHFAGPIAHRFTAIGLLFFSCIFAALGLYILSLVDAPLPAFFASTIWAIGVCYMWPTMLACVAERFPNGGALFLGLLGFAGGLSIYFILPQMGAIFDEAKIEAAGGLAQLQALEGEALAEVNRIASAQSFRSVALVPLMLLPVFGAIWWFDKKYAERQVMAPKDPDAEFPTESRKL